MRPGVELLLGRQSMLNLDLGVSGVQETVTVTGEAPLIDTTTSNIAGNIDPRQMQDLPINGRNWMDLTMLAPGSRSNSAAEIPQNRQGMFQINVDGQQVTFTLCCFENQPRYSRDAIAEFELTTNRFDATKGRTSGMMVNAITKSGTNTPSGTFSGYFRDDRFNAADFIQHRVIPYSDQQYSGTFGGPIVRDRIHFFVNGEWEREPSTVTFNSPYSSFNIDLTQPRKEQKWGPKIDWQFTPQARLMSRYTRYQNVIPYLSTGGATNHPSTAQQTQRIANQSFTEFNQVLSSRTLNSVKFGTAYMRYLLEPYAGWGRSGNRRPPGTASLFRDVFGGEEIDGGVVRITFSGYTLGNNNNPQSSGERVYNVRDDFSTSYNLGGRHDIKTGLEYIRYTMDTAWCNGCNGTIRINARPPANIEQLIPVWDDASTWNLNALSPLIVDYTMAIGDFAWAINRNIWAGWYQDDWSVSNRLTVNLGVRYDVDFGGMGEKIVFEPWLTGRRPTDSNNVAPRTGFAYSLSDRSVVRGGCCPQVAAAARTLSAHDSERRSSGLRDEPVQRSGAELRIGARQAVRCQRQSARLYRAIGPQRDSLRRSPDPVQPHGVDRYPAPAGGADGRRVQLRVHRWPEGRVRSEHQPDLRPGHRHELSVPDHCPASLSGLGRDPRENHGSPVELPRVGKQFHQALLRSLAGERHLRAGVVPRR
jgi:hypothetical protein